MYKEVAFSEISREALEQLSKGAFLTVRNCNKTNTMTIGWGALGYIWGKPVFIAMVRHSRYTFELIEKANDFTVSFPSKGEMKGELAFCGTKSGRDCDKFKECSIKAKDGDTTLSPVIEGCRLFFECRTLYKQPMLKENLNKEIRDRWYGDGDYHTIYFGEITKAYIFEG